MKKIMKIHLLIKKINNLFIQLISNNTTHNQKYTKITKNKIIKCKILSSKIVNNRIIKNRMISNKIIKNRMNKIQFNLSLIFRNMIN